LVLPAFSGALFRFANWVTIHFAHFTAAGQKFSGEMVKKLPNAGGGCYDWGAAGARAARDNDKLIFPIVRSAPQLFPMALPF
jgi:hypothetical protein